jgi:DNA-binding beta-propeller fold protein YncE
VIDTSTGSVVSSIPVGTAPTALRISPDGLTGYVANQTSNTVSVIALDTFPALDAASLPLGTEGAPYTATIGSSGRPAPTFSLASGALPPGLSLDSAGVVAGTPTAAGTFTFTVTASSVVSGIPASAQGTYSITVSPAPVASLIAADDDFTGTPVPATGGTAGNVLVNDTIDGSRPTSADVTLELTDAGGITGAALSADGMLTLPNGASAGTHTLTYQVCETAHPQNCATATISVRLLTAVVVPGAPTTSRLATTGSNLVPPLLGAAGLLLLGGATILLKRRVHRTSN